MTSSINSDDNQRESSGRPGAFAMPGDAVAEVVRYGVRFGGIGLLVPEATFSEVVVKKDVYPLPNTQPWLQGILNDHGDMVPVYDLPLFFGMDLLDARRDILLIIDQREYAVAIRVPEYPKAVRGGTEAGDAVQEGIPEPLREYVSKVYQANGERWIDFRHRDFFMSLKALVTS